MNTIDFIFAFNDEANQPQLHFVQSCMPADSEKGSSRIVLVLRLSCWNEGNYLNVINVVLPFSSNFRNVAKLSMQDSEHTLPESHSILPLSSHNPCLELS